MQRAMLAERKAQQAKSNKIQLDTQAKNRHKKTVSSVR
jgi:hypothetical protein